MDAFLTAVRDLLGPRGFTCDPERVDPWLTDWRGRYTGRALGLASPGDTAAVAAFVTLCAAHGVPIVPQGGNSGMSGGATPDASGRHVLLSLRRMDRIRTLDPDARIASCEAGVVLQTLHEAADAQALRFPLTLGGRGSATVGGLVSTNAGGTQVLRHGTMRSQVLGLEAVLANGAVLDLTSPLKKDNRGFDLKQLLIGSEGTLGIVTAATLRLLPATGGRVVAWAEVPAPHAARALLLRLEAMVGDAVEGFELLPERSLAAVIAHAPGARRPLAGAHPWHVLAEAVVPRGGDRAGLQAAVETALAAGIAAGETDDAVIAANEAQADAFWHLRDGIAAAERALGPALQHDIAVPVAAMPAFIDATIPAVEARFPGTVAIAFGHLGDGNVHFHVRAPAETDGADADSGAWEDEAGAAISAFVHDKVVAAGGTISAEHGIGQVKTAELARLTDPARLSVMHAIKRALDPHGLLNPGKLLPLAPGGAEA